MVLLTRYEVARIVGLRALQLESGDPCKLDTMPASPVLKVDFIYLASRELAEGRIDAVVEREGIGQFHLSDAVNPQELSILLDTYDGGSRGRGS